jgi:hypothetical protein
MKQARKMISKGKYVRSSTVLFTKRIMILVPLCSPSLLCDMLYYHLLHGYVALDVSSSLPSILLYPFSTSFACSFTPSLSSPLLLRIPSSVLSSLSLSLSLFTLSPPLRSLLNMLSSPLHAPHPDRHTRPYYPRRYPRSLHTPLSCSPFPLLTDHTPLSTTHPNSPYLTTHHSHKLPLPQVFWASRKGE